MINVVAEFAGIDQRLESSKAPDDGTYYLLVNGRTRRNTIEPVQLPTKLDLPDGTIQGLYGFGKYALVFIGGAGYYRNFDEGGPWRIISGLAMSAAAERVYVAAVPGALVRYRRIGAAPKSDVELGAPVLPSPAAFVVMDGESQPWIVFDDGSARVTGTFATHSADDPEYVPAACKFPTYVGGKLYCVGKDINGRYTQIYHSATGQPLNFMVAVNEDGEKISADEVVHGANAVATSVDFNEVTGLHRLPAAGGVFLVSTINNTYLVQPDESFLLYGEPFHNHQFLFPVGALNDQSVVDILGDTAVIHASGIRSFNAIQTLQNEGRNSPFSQAVNDLFEGVTQTAGASVAFENYVAFSVSTTFGDGILWFDTIIQAFVSLDIYPTVGRVTQFAVINVTGEAPRLLFYTADNYVYEAFTGDTATVRFYSRDYLPQQVDDVRTNDEHRITTALLAFADVTADGYVGVTPFTDKVMGTRRLQILTAGAAAASGGPNPFPGPIVRSDQTAMAPFDLRVETTFGSRIGLLVEFNCAAKFLGMRFSTEQRNGAIEMNVAQPTTLADETRLVFVGDDGVISDTRTTLHTAMRVENPTAVIGLGDHAYDSGTVAEVAARLSAYWVTPALAGKFFAVPGNHDLDTDAGEPFFSALRQAPTRYFSRVFGFVEVFFVNSGLNTAGAQIEPDNTDGATLATSRQFRWLKRKLAESTAPHKIVVWHHPPHTSNANYFPGVAAMQSVPLAAWGATALICGHAHCYERLFIDGLTHYVVGTGGRELTGFAATPLASSHARENRYGYLRMVAGPFSARFEFVDINGVVYDKYAINV